MKFKHLIQTLIITAALTALSVPAYALNEKDIAVPENYPKKYTAQYIKMIEPEYKAIGKDYIFYVALDMLKGTNGEFSRHAILGNNLTQRPVKIEFRDLGTINPAYANFDALE